MIQTGSRVCKTAYAWLSCDMFEIRTQFQVERLHDGVPAGCPLAELLPLVLLPERSICLAALLGDGRIHMPRYYPVLTDASEWIDVSPDRPCAFCGALEGCGAMRDGSFARCVKQPSEWPLVTGGWLHRVEVRVEQIVVS
jgi:hypothetical protein